jgi:putative transposase
MLAFSAFPQAHWHKLWSTNPLERVNDEIKRRSNVVGIFPNDAAIARRVTAVVFETHDEWAVAERRYLRRIHGPDGEPPALAIEAPKALRGSA